MDYCGLSCAAFQGWGGVRGSREAWLKGKNGLRKPSSHDNMQIIIVKFR